MSSKKIEANSNKRTGIVMANDLRSGVTVFLTATSEWSEQVSEALVIEGQASADNALRVAAVAEADNKVTGAYLADSNRCGDPIVLREMLRVQGPSVDYMPDDVLPDHLRSVSVRSASMHTALVSAAGEI